MAELYLIRHAQASFGAENYDKLSVLGHQQSEWLGQYLAQEQLDFDNVVLGDMVRHRETLEGLHKGISAHPNFSELDKKIQGATVFPELNEFDFKAVATGFLTIHPELEPKKSEDRTEFYRVFKLAMRAWSDGALDELVPEKFSEFQQRVISFLETLSQEHVGKKVLAVTSGGAIGMALSHLLGTNHDSMIDLNLQIRNTSITHCFFNEKRARLHSFNNVPHLDNLDKREFITYS